MCFYYDDHADIYNERRLKCRKAHPCYSCDETIDAGKPALYIKGMFDGRWFWYYICENCERLQIAVAIKEVQEDCPNHTAWCAFEDLAEYLDEAKEDGVTITPVEGPIAEAKQRVWDIAEERRQARLTNNYYSQTMTHG
jgi:uncharacterized CHY-type Zn-finger protein